MRHAMSLLSEMHININTLTTALQFPVSDWDEKWMDVYLNDSVKLLDICNALTSELSRLEQCQLLLKYSLHILDSTGSSPTSEDLKRVHSSLHNWMEKIHSRSPKLESSSSILQELTATLQLVKVKKSAKGKVLMRALYGVKVVSIFVCSVFTAALSGCSKPLTDLHISGDFLWAEAFGDLQASVNGEIRYLLKLGKCGVLKELEAVSARAVKLHDLSIGLDQRKKDKPSTDADKDTNTEEVERWKDSTSDLAKSAETFACELDLLSKQVEEFFHLVLGGRNVLLCSLTTSNVQGKGKADKVR
ncbi:uncharacterized protein A4U43_C08F2730 [Asparagus officinalis]|nr:uncharacterized protein A4U43_C08F2730 [Asparagus officinalis]